MRDLETWKLKRKYITIDINIVESLGQVLEGYGKVRSRVHFILILPPVAASSQSQLRA